jgi:hypothetical protein
MTLRRFVHQTKLLDRKQISSASRKPAWHSSRLAYLTRETLLNMPPS